MQRTTIQVIWAHPRSDSLTAAIADDMIKELRGLGRDVEVIDVYRSGFDPVLHEADEPDLENLDKQYTPEVMEAAARTAGAAAVIFVFPVWWYSMPAALKGYIDRVWNYGIFYGGGRRTGLPAVRWVGLAGDTEAKYTKREYDSMMAHHLNQGIAGYCGVSDSRLELLYDTFASEADDPATHITTLRQQARTIAAALHSQTGDTQATPR
ncbi:NAD(P)H oxidoreductase [Streptomyces sp. NPDC096310]|uniref:NAD(P)H oxidoreductase n=1 Tax=Streptomyces sp. NPDC096310 TaxID=3366082 RepID=UPI0037F1C865